MRLSELLKEEANLQERLDKEVPEFKFKKGDPFELAKGGWGVPYKRLKELLEED